MSRTADALLVQHNLKALNLTNMARHLEQQLRQARDGGIDYGQFLLELTELELRIRSENSEKRRLKEAKFPLLKPLETFDFEAVPELDKRLMRDLAAGDYLKNRRNVI
ncbi:MAG: ATP-binding protein, partial [Armatimonadia bacterium]